MAKFALTTNDNIYNPFEDFVAWFQFDTSKGYNSSSKIARELLVLFPDSNPDELSEEEEELQNNLAIDSVIANDFLNIYVKVTEEDYKNGKFPFEKVKTVIEEE